MALKSIGGRRIILSLLSVATFAVPGIAFAQVYGGGNFGGSNYNVGDLPAAAAAAPSGGGTQVLGSSPTAPGYVNTNPTGAGSTTISTGTVMMTDATSSTAATMTASGTVVTSAPASTANPFTISLQYRDSSPEVRLLQIYLNSHGFPLAASGDGSSGQETDFFGALTYRALVAFQTAHAADILAPLGLSIGTGYFGPATMAYFSQHP